MTTLNIQFNKIQIPSFANFISNEIIALVTLSKHNLFGKRMVQTFFYIIINILCLNNDIG